MTQFEEIYRSTIWAGFEMDKWPLPDGGLVLRIFCEDDIITYLTFDPEGDLVNACEYPAF